MTTIKSGTKADDTAVETEEVIGLDNFDADTVLAIKHLLIASGEVFAGAGPVIRNLEADWTKSFLTQDRAAYTACEVKYNALKALVGHMRQSICSKYDMATSGYVDATWLDGVERLVQKSETPRGRKPAIKVDPADLV